MIKVCENYCAIYKLWLGGYVIPTINKLLFKISKSINHTVILVERLQKHSFLFQVKKKKREHLQFMTRVICYIKILKKTSIPTPINSIQKKNPYSQNLYQV